MISAVGMQTSALIAIVVLLVALSRVLASLSRGDSSPTNGRELTGEPAEHASTVLPRPVPAPRAGSQSRTRERGAAHG
jgi:hypothetical protein